ncbi:uncharacterized protein STEHIDRAFT_80666 [Stereum hirsutum FP-91666 SS1]|uniref:uncharacterized protein n=1 Tax=Stereum hirsutum (strain FP-91666) TaxID=721885 RepID=UPI0004449BCB|nr:uncharacterized protein STEHIDRAFT_80666 [Stereum hirsutum FP-91666 SS1]EIM85304.1 hypothetical protein STEHIDRAFT_80666 [Stereum hirsutum FP-91666 SS1]
MTRTTLPPAYFFEDRTGAVEDSDFDEVYDRMFLRTSSKLHRTQGPSISVFETGRRSTSSRHQERSPHEPSFIMEFGTNGALGTIWFMKERTSMPMYRYLRKISLFGGSRSRKFTASDGREYRWGYGMEADQEWTCVNVDDEVVAQYSLKHPNRPAYSTSGNVFTVYEAFAHLSTEFLATLTIMRHIAKHNL